MKHLLLTTIAAVVLAGCGNLDRALFTAVHEESIQAVEQAIAAGADVNAKDGGADTPLDEASGATADLLRKHGGKTGEELKAEDK